MEETKNYTLPSLYSKTKSEKVYFWKVYVVNNILYKTWGYTDGKKQTCQKECLGKNIGKKNETSGFEQAKKEAISNWEKQIKKGYTVNESDEEGNEYLSLHLKDKNNEIKVSKNYKNISDKKYYPMLCDKWENNSKCLKYFNFDVGVWIQPKLDGWRCIVRKENDNIILSSRQCKQYPWFKHLRDSSMKLLEKHQNIILDCEIYNNIMFNKNGEEIEPNERYKIISKCCGINRKSPHELENNMKLYVFDIVDTNKTQQERFDILDSLFVNNQDDNVVLVNRELINDVKDVDLKEKLWRERGYEGIILRSFENPYVLKHRSKYMRKHKCFLDDECLIIDADKSIDDNVVWKCLYKNKEFSITQRGTEQERKNYYINRDKYIGKMLKFTYQNLTSDGIPRFGVGVEIRNEFEEEL